MLNARSIRLRPVVSLLALIVVALIAGFAPGAAHADRLANARAEADQAQADLQVLNDKVAVAAEAYNAAQQQLDETNAKIDENQQVLAVTRSNLSVSRRELSTMLVDAYRQGNPDLIAFLLDQTRFIQRVTGHAEGVVRDVRRYTSDVKQREQALEEERGARQSALQDRAAQEASVRETLAARTRLLNSLSTEIQGIIAQREAAQRAADAARAAEAGGILADASAGAGSADLSIGGSVGGGADYTASIPAPPSSSTGGSAASVALGQLGTPYVWGGGAPGGFDCSGLIAWAYAQVGISLPHYAAAQYAMGTPVPMDALEPGDLISFHGSGHIGMYIGSGQYVHAPQTGDFVKVSTLADRSDADGAVRVG